MIAGQSEHRLAGLLEGAPDAMVVVNQEGEILLVNLQTERMFGYPRDELLGHPVELLVPAPLREQHIRHRSEYYANPHSRPIGVGEFQAQRKDGSVFPVEINLAPFETENGLLVVSALRDITQRKQTELRLQQSEERLRLLIEEVKDYAIFMLDPEGRVASWNKGAERMRGYHAEEIMGRHFSCFYTPEDTKAGKPQEELDQALAEGRVETEGWRVRKDGSRFWSNVVLTALKDKQGRFVGFTKVARDITERKRAREALLLEVSNLLVSKLDVRDLFSAISSCLRQIKESDYAGLALYDPAIRKLRVYALPSPAGKDLIHEEILLPLENSPAGWAFKARKPVVLNQVREEGRPFEIPANLIAQGIKSVSRMPLISRDRVLGTLNLGSRREGAFSDEDVSLLTQVANQIAIALDNAMAFRQLSQLKERLAEEKSYLEDEIRTKFNFDEIVGESRVLKRVLKQVERVAPTDSTVLILGETGTGKELIARAIHRLSPRHHKTFVHANCSELPASLIESELFGHEKGAFTGSTARQIGRLELAHQGTLFLDEVGDIPLELQSKLLRALQEKQFERLGSTQTISVDLRVIAATNRDLFRMMENGQFRSDLYYRLNVFPITVTPLRERAEDILLLARHFMTRYARRLGKVIETIPADTIRSLTRYPWPGNVRELEHFIERAVILTDGPVLHAPPFQLKMAAKSAEPSKESTLAEVEREHILRVLREANGIIGGPRGAAARLGLKRTTLGAKMRKLGISRQDI